MGVLGPAPGYTKEGQSTYLLANEKAYEEGIPDDGELEGSVDDFKG